jgi:hypothetical protein
MYLETVEVEFNRDYTYNGYDTPHLHGRVHPSSANPSSSNQLQICIITYNLLHSRLFRNIRVYSKTKPSTK